MLMVRYSLNFWIEHIKTKKGVAVLAKSRQMEREHLLAVPITESNSGLHQFKAVTQVLEDWGLKEHILGFGFDTTSP